MRKNILITGCSSGIGYETALKFARNGWTTFASFRSLSSKGVEELRKIAESEKLPLHLLQIDVTNEKSVASGIAEVLTKQTHIDVLVNNAGFGYLGAIEDFTIDEIKEQYETNLFGYLRMIKALLPLMRKQRSGLIINISSINGLLSFPLFGVYSSSKFAIVTLSEVLRLELHPFGIKVALVEPGSFLTKFGYNRKHPTNQGSNKSPYKFWTTAFFSTYDNAHKVNNKIVNRLTDHKRVANRIYDVANSDNPSLRNVIGVDAHLYLFLRKILPERVRFFLLQRAYKWS